MRRCAGTGANGTPARTVIGASGVARRRWRRGWTSERGAAYSRHGPFGNGDQRDRWADWPSPLTPEAVATPHHAPPVVRAPRVPSSTPSSRPGRVELSRVESARSPAGRVNAHSTVQCRQPALKRRVLIRHASVLPHTAYRAPLARPRHARSRVRPSQVKSTPRAGVRVILRSGVAHLLTTI